MDDSDDLLETYRMTNRDGRDRLRSYAKQLQKRFPEPDRSTFALVKNANYVKPINHVGHGRVDLRPLSTVGETINSK